MNSMKEWSSIGLQVSLNVAHNYLVIAIIHWVQWSYKCKP